MGTLLSSAKSEFLHLEIEDNASTCIIHSLKLRIRKSKVYYCQLSEILSIIIIIKVNLGLHVFNFSSCLLSTPP